MLTIRPTRFTDRLPKTPDFEVRSGGLGVGRIYEDTTSAQPQYRWYWTITGVQACSSHPASVASTVLGHAQALAAG